MSTPRTLVAPRGRRRGYSLLEFVIAMLIALILSAMGAAGYQVYRRGAPVRSAARRLAHACSGARAWAIAHNSHYSVQIDWIADPRKGPGLNQSYENFWIDETDAFGTPLNHQAHKVEGVESFGEKIRVESVNYSATSPPQPLPPAPYHSLRFHPDGSSDDATVVLIRRDQPAAQTQTVYTIRLFGPTGQAKVYEHERRTP